MLRVTSAWLGFAGFGWLPLRFTVFGFAPCVFLFQDQPGIRPGPTTTYCCNDRGRSDSDWQKLAILLTALDKMWNLLYLFTFHWPKQITCQSPTVLGPGLILLPWVGAGLSKWVVNIWWLILSTTGCDQEADYSTRGGVDNLFFFFF